MAYLFTDFVTRMPIQEEFEPTTPYILTFAERPHQAIEGNTSYNNQIYQPVTFPIVVLYSGHGVFTPHPDFDNMNQILWGLTQKTKLPETFDQNDYDYNYDNNQYVEFMTVTSYIDFCNVGQYLIDTPIRQGVFRKNETYREKFLKNLEKQQTPITEDYDEFTHGFEMALPENNISRPDMTSRSNGGSISKLQTLIGQITEPQTIQHLMYHNCFQAYLEIIRVPYYPVSGIGSQTDDIDMLYLFNDQVERSISQTASQQLELALEDQLLGVREFRYFDKLNLQQKSELGQSIDHSIKLLKQIAKRHEIAFITKDTSYPKLEALGKLATFNECKRLITLNNEQKSICQSIK